MNAPTYAVIGSGPSGVNAALTLLERGKTVVLYDVGIQEREIPHSESTFNGLKSLLADPISYFLGENFSGVIPPASGRLFDYPPVRNFRLNSTNPLLKFSANGFRPVISHNFGGLGVAWGANSVPYDDNDMRDWPIGLSDLREGYQVAGDRMNISDSLKLNVHDTVLWTRYQKKKKLAQDHGIVINRARMAVDTRTDSPTQCTYCGRCLWGCGSDSIYNPRLILKQCRQYPNFTYHPHAFITHFIAEEGRVRSVAYYDTQEKTKNEVPADVVFLAAGALSSGGIFLRTLQRDPEMTVRVRGTKSLLDTQVIKIPYLLPRMIGKKNDDRDFQFNKLILEYHNEKYAEFPQGIHAEILSLTNLLYHPLIEFLPLGSLFSSKVFSLLKPALGAITLFAPDVPHADNGITLEPDETSITGDRMKFVYTNSSNKKLLMKEAVQSVKRAFRKMGGFLLERNILNLPAGSGIHYAGTIPMSSREDILCVDKAGASYAYPNLYVVDGAAFPTLPSKSITMSLVANAIRVAKAA